MTNSRDWVTSGNSLVKVSNELGNDSVKQNVRVLCLLSCNARITLALLS